MPFRGTLPLGVGLSPEELIALVGYLESVTEGLLVDLVAVSAYEVNGSHVVIPQRVDAEEPATGSGDEGPSPDRPKGRLVEGAADFAVAIGEAPPENRDGANHRFWTDSGKRDKRPLRDRELFEQVRVDPEVHTIL